MCGHTQGCIHVCSCVCMSTHVCYIHGCTHVCALCACIHACVCAFAWVHACVHTQGAHMCMCTYGCVYLQVCMGEGEAVLHQPHQKVRPKCRQPRARRGPCILASPSGSPRPPSVQSPLPSTLWPTVSSCHQLPPASDSQGYLVTTGLLRRPQLFLHYSGAKTKSHKRTFRA